MKFTWFPSRALGRECRFPPAEALSRDGGEMDANCSISRLRPVRELTSRTRGVSIEKMAEELARYLRGWIGYFGNCETPSVLERLEEWIRRRLRAAIWKQWKRGTKRFAELRNRGVGTDLAAKTAGSAHGPWQLANSPALALALPNTYFTSLGIPRLTACR
jgi:RNA-directed DNA polymerase